MDTRPATAFVLIAYMSDFSGRHTADMKRPRELPRWFYIIGLVLGITLIIGFFVELLVFNRWMPSLAISGVGYTLLFVYWLFFEHRRQRHFFIIGLVCGITFIIGFFIRLLVVGRWDLWLALGGLVFTTMSAYELFFKRRV
jgi:membrane associated rhomboid family serine protease